MKLIINNGYMFKFKGTWHYDVLINPCSFKVINSDELNHIVIYKR